MFNWIKKLFHKEQKPKLVTKKHEHYSEPELPPATDDEVYWWCDSHPWIPMRPDRQYKQVICTYHTDWCKKQMGDETYWQPDPSTNEGRWNKLCVCGSTWQVDGWNYKTGKSLNKPVILKICQSQDK
jgi:hypothetical protein